MSSTEIVIPQSESEALDDYLCKKLKGTENSIINAGLAAPYAIALIRAGIWKLESLTRESYIVSTDTCRIVSIVLQDGNDHKEVYDAHIEGSSIRS